MIKLIRKTGPFGSNTQNFWLTFLYSCSMTLNLEALNNLETQGFFSQSLNKFTFPLKGKVILKVFVQSFSEDTLSMWQFILKKFSIQRFFNVKNWNFDSFYSFLHVNTLTPKLKVEYHFSGVCSTE